MSEPKQQTRIDLHSLSLPQLNEVKQQMEQEIEHLSESYQKLREAQRKFKECSDAVKKTSDETNSDKPILVPLTSSLYVPGKMKDIKKYMVDIGTGYYVEKTSEDSIKFFDKKVGTLEKNVGQLESIVEGKVANLQSVEQVMSQRLAEAQAQSQNQGQK